PSGLSDLLAVTACATERAIDVQALFRQARPPLRIQFRAIHHIRRLLRVAQLQLWLEYQSEPRQGEREKDSEEAERAVVHRATSAIWGLTTARIAGTQHARQQRTSHTPRFSASSALPATINTSPKVLTRINSRPMWS